MNIKTQKEDILKIKKFLSFVLRHKPFLYKIKLDKEGFASLEELLNTLKSHQKIELTTEEFIYIIKDLSGGIFKLNKDRTRVAARFGHTFIYNLSIPEGFVEVDKIPSELFFVINKNDLTPILDTEFIPASNKVIRILKTIPKKEENYSCCKINGHKINLKTHKFYYNEKENCYFTKIIPISSISLNV